MLNSCPKSGTSAVTAEVNLVNDNIIAYINIDGFEKYSSSDIRNKVKNGEPVGVGLKICMLLFVSLIGGIFALCMGDAKAKK